jgi:hypothetical protein
MPCESSSDKLREFQQIVFWDPRLWLHFVGARLRPHYVEDFLSHYLFYTWWVTKIVGAHLGPHFVGDSRFRFRLAQVELWCLSAPKCR